MTVALALHSSWGKYITYPRVIGPIEGKKEQSVGKKFLGWHEMKPPKGNAKITSLNHSFVLQVRSLCPRKSVQHGFVYQMTVKQP